MGFGHPNLRFGYPNLRFRHKNCGFGHPNQGFGRTNLRFGPPNPGFGCPNPNVDIQIFDFEQKFIENVGFGGGLAPGGKQNVQAIAD